jgi:DNA recombination protein RmuC
MEFSRIFSLQVGRVGDTAVTLGHVLGVCAFAVLLLLGALVVALVRSAAARSRADALAAEQARESGMRLAELVRSQSELQGRMAAMADVFGARQAELNQSLGARLDTMTGRLGTTLAEQTKSTQESLGRLQERLAVIDTAQGNIQSLAGQVVQLQAILSNKQTRGAFGQSRMEAIVADGLPAGAYAFQHTLSNGSRPDCVVKLPNGSPWLVIDAKFPLESWNAVRAASETGGEMLKLAQQSFRRDMDVHIRAIAEKYLIAGETHDTAFLFVPSESIFADIHESFEPIVQRAQRARLVIVSPSLLMLSIQVIQSILKDASMREQAHLIQGEVRKLLEDVGRMDERVRKLQVHFGQASRDIDDILVSSAKITRRGARIEAVELADDARPAAAANADAAGPDVGASSGRLRLRVVDDNDH